MSTAIVIEHVSKIFSLKQAAPRSFQELVIDLFGRTARSKEERFVALENVSLEIEQGETVGLIGANGAGKSTLLKLVAGIIEPTSGNVEVNGRVGALLELGAGFHPDLTGRENIYLNGSILGLSRTEIRDKMGEIIAFAELERFIDAPVRHYSSGMYVRLGFSVAVHTEPEVLLVDEVLAVGDASFQRKCMDKIDEMRNTSVTILFVSHNPGLVRKICKRAVWLDEGCCIADGSAEAVVAQYLDHAWGEGDGHAVSGAGRRWGSGKVRIVEVRLLDGGGQERQRFLTGEPMTVEMRYVAEERVERPVFGLAIHRSDGMHITGPNTQFAGQEIPWIEGKGVVRYTVPTLPLLEGRYYISVAAHNWEDTEMYDYQDRAYTFRAEHNQGERYGVVTLQGGWSWNGQAS
jgi:ABC-type polysaccharide/polyol phosphate transport system ATPase subunit